jgi:hypothetical protein
MVATMAFDEQSFNGSNFIKAIVITILLDSAASPVTTSTGDANRLAIPPFLRRVVP